MGGGLNLGQRNKIFLIGSTLATLTTIHSVACVTVARCIEKAGRQPSSFYDVWLNVQFDCRLVVRGMYGKLQNH